MLTSTSRLFVMFVCCYLIFGLQAVSLAQAKEVDVVYNTPFNARYLYPGGKVVMEMDWLALPDERVMVLTFDDGPDARDLKISALLKQFGVPAAFFYIGERAVGMPEIVRAIQADHHEIGYHSYHHEKMSWLAQPGLQADFQLGQTAMKRLGVSMAWFRPPYGDFNASVVQAAKHQGLETLLWTIDSRDWTGVTPETMAKNVIRQFHPGAVLLFHSLHDVTLEALPEVLAAAEAQQYRFVSLSEWQQIIQKSNCRVDKRLCPALLSAGVAALAPVNALTEGESVEPLLDDEEEDLSHRVVPQYQDLESRQISEPSLIDVSTLSEDLEFTLPIESQVKPDVGLLPIESESAASVVKMPVETGKALLRTIDALPVVKSEETSSRLDSDLNTTATVGSKQLIHGEESLVPGFVRVQAGEESLVDSDRSVVDVDAEGNTSVVMRHTSSRLFQGQESLVPVLTRVTILDTHAVTTKHPDGEGAYANSGGSALGVDAN